MFETIGDGISNFFTSTIDDIKKKLGIQSPSKVFETIGSNMMTGLARGIARSAALPEIALNGVALNAASGVRAYVNVEPIEARRAGGGAAIYNTYNNYIEDTLAARVVLEQQRIEQVRSVREAM